MDSTIILGRRNEIHKRSYHVAYPCPSQVQFRSGPSPGRIPIDGEGEFSVLFSYNFAQTKNKQARGVNLQTIYADLPVDTKEKIVASLATYMAEVFKHRLDGIGSLEFSRTSGFPDIEVSHFVQIYVVIVQRAEHHCMKVGQITSDPFWIDGRSELKLDRGPWKTARDYFDACAQRELDVSARQDRAQTGSLTYRSYLGLMFVTPFSNFFSCSSRENLGRRTLDCTTDHDALSGYCGSM